jgi:hypothetical protein
MTALLYSVEVNLTPTLGSHAQREMSPIGLLCKYNFLQDHLGKFLLDRLLFYPGLKTSIIEIVSMLTMR